MTDLVKKIVAPVRLEYTITPGDAYARTLRAFQEGRILGNRCPVTGKVYAPGRGLSPTEGLPAPEEVEVRDTGIVTTFCVVNIPFEGQKLPIPYVAAAILLDGADVPLFHLIGDCPPEEARMGMRVKAVWAAPGERLPSAEAIRYFKPTGEPDAPFDAYREHL